MADATGGLATGLYWIATGKLPAEELKEKPKDKREQKDKKDPKNLYALPAEKGMPREHPLWKGHAWQPTGVEYNWATGVFSDGYRPGPGDRPKF